MKLFRRNSKIIINGKKALTLHKICKLMDISVPRKFKSIQNQINNDITLIHTKIKAGSIYIILDDDINVKKRIELAVQKGAKVIFVDEKDFISSALDVDEYPVILMNDKINQVGRLFAAIRNSYDANVVSITGTVGKTTTKSFCEVLAKEKFQTFASAGNKNSYTRTAEHILKNLNNSTDIFIQEVGAHNPNRVRKSAVMLEPNVFILLNVLNHHLEEYKTYDNLFKDKVCIDEYVKPDGVVIANYDDVNIAKHTFKHKVISFGIDTEKEVDYRAVNIVQNKEFLEFDIEHDQKKSHIKINILGEHNAYNALAAFVMAKHLGMSDDEIANGFLSYHSESIRQNLVNIGGKYLFVDCYNVTEASILATLDVVNKFEINNKKKKVVVLGGENGIGDDIATFHIDLGERIAPYIPENFALIGTDQRDMKSINRYGDAYSMAQGIEKAGRSDVKVYDNNDDLVQYLMHTVNRGDLLAIKCIVYLKASIAIDKAFGTNFTYSYSGYLVNLIKINENGIKAHVIPDFGEAEIKKINIKEVLLEIPEMLKEYPVFRIGEESVKNNKKIRKINFNRSCRNIGKRSFYGCTSLIELDIPGNVKVIEEGAFEKCIGLKKVILNDGVTHISRHAFFGNSNLEKIYISDSVGLIEYGAFDGCDNLTIYCKEGTVAEHYAKENGIKLCTN